MVPETDDTNWRIDERLVYHRLCRHPRKRHYRESGRTRTAGHAQIYSLAHFLKQCKILQACIAGYLELGLTFFVDDDFDNIARRRSRDNMLMGGLLLDLLLLLKSDGRTWRYLFGVGELVILASLTVVLAMAD